MSGTDEFGEIERLFRPLTHGAPGAFGLMDDAAVVPQRPGCDLVVTKDAVVEGVHFPVGAPPEDVARRLVRVNLSDLAAKAAEPFAAFLAVGWPESFGPAEREAFARGLGEDLAQFGVALMGGDTVRTPGPFWASLTALGWVPEGRMVRRAGAQVGEAVFVSGTIGDGTLGLAALRGEVADPEGALAERFRRPRPRLELREPLRALATAAADVSDGLVADAGHIAQASGVRMVLDLERLPLSAAARAWVDAHPDRAAGLIRLATGGDDYEVVCTAPAGAHLAGFVAIGSVEAGEGVEARVDGRPVDAGAGGWRHL